MDEYEYDREAELLESVCKKIAPSRRIRVWRFAQAKPAKVYPLYLRVELRLNVDGKEYAATAEQNHMQWLKMPEHHRGMALANIRFLLARIAQELVG